MNYKLVGSHENIEVLKDMLLKKWYWSSVMFDVETGEVFSSHKKIEDLRIIKKKNRYRLERKV